MNKERRAAVRAAEAILSDPFEEQQSVPYTLKIPTETLFMFRDKLEDYMMTHANIFGPDGEVVPKSQAVIHPDSKYALLHTKVSAIIESGHPKLVIFPCTGREVDTFAEVILYDAEDQYIDGYERFISTEERFEQRNNAFVFLDFLDAFTDAGGDEKCEHIATYEYFRKTNPEIAEGPSDGWT
jgi:hypothetical protein